MSQAVLRTPGGTQRRVASGTRNSMLTRLLPWLPLGVTLSIVIATAALYFVSPEVQAEVNRAIEVLGSGDGQTIRQYLLSFGAWAPAISMLLMLLQSIVTPLPAVFIVFANGLAFGPFWGGVISLAGQSAAASACFWFARSAGRYPVEKLTGRLGVGRFESWFERWGVTGIWISRMIPGISFDAVSYASGLTPVRYWRFLLATAAGIAPQSFLYAYLIHHAPHLAWLVLAGSLLVAGLGAVGIVVVRRRSRPGRAAGQKVVTS